MIGRGEDRRVPESQLVVACREILAEQIVQLGRGQILLELVREHHLAQIGIGLQQHVVVEEHVVDADDPFLAQNAVVDLVTAPMHGQPEPEVDVVIEIGARRYDPVDEPGPDQRHQHRPAEARGGHRPGERDADPAVRREHLLHEQLRCRSQLSRVVGQIGPVHEVGNTEAPGDRVGVDPLAG